MDFMCMCGQGEVKCSSKNAPQTSGLSHGVDAGAGAKTRTPGAGADGA